MRPAVFGNNLGVQWCYFAPGLLGFVLAWIVLRSNTLPGEYLLVNKFAIKITTLVLTIVQHFQLEVVR